VNLKLEELRKRLLEPMPTTGSGHSNAVYRRNTSELYSTPPPLAHQAFTETDPQEAEEPADEAAAFDTQAFDEVDATPQPAAEPASAVTNAVLQYVQEAAAAIPQAQVSESNGQYQLVEAVAKVFEQTWDFQHQFSELTEMFTPIERASRVAVRSFEPLQDFEQQIAQLARSFEPLRSFQNQLAELADTFEPMRGLQQQLVQLAEAFQLHLRRLSRSLEPAREFQLELIRLANAFESAIELQNQFDSLAETFRAG
jgi:hypothetical protein